MTSDRISDLRVPGHPNDPLTRSQLCNLLVNNHNGYLCTSGQRHTNQRFLGQSVSVSSCVNALTYTRGYDTKSGHAQVVIGWSKYGNRVFNDGARWDRSYLSSG